jgi:hypothetical protein
MRYLLRWSLLPLLILATFSSPAQDRIFNYTYQSLVLGKGQRELEVWNTFRWGRSEYFRAFDNRIEFEVGLGSRLQTAFYLNIGTASVKQLSYESTASGTGQPVPVSTWSLGTETEVSFSNEWKYKIADPVADAVGLALYGEYTVSAKGIELEPRVILDKSYGAAIVAFNAAGEFEFEKQLEQDGTEQTATESGLELTLAGSWELARGVHLGAEIVNRNGFEEGTLLHSVLFGGPTIAYAQQDFWINLTILPQLVALKGATENGLALDIYERLETRLLFSYAF